MFSIAPSLMCANLLQLEQEVRELERAPVEFFHLDIMDGNFVPNLGLSLDLAKQLKSITEVPLDVHLMVQNPEEYGQQIAAIGIQFVSFHVEATRSPIRLARSLRAGGAQVGIALNPATPIDVLREIVHEFDYVLAMTVEPGFAGQRFISSMYDKVRRIRELLDEVRTGIPIQVDGNLDVHSSSRCIELGATMLVGGTSSVFRREKGLLLDCLTFRQQVEQEIASGARSAKQLGAAGSGAANL